MIGDGSEVYASWDSESGKPPEVLWWFFVAIVVGIFYAVTRALAAVFGGAA